MIPRFKTSHFLFTVSALTFMPVAFALETNENLGFDIKISLSKKAAAKLQSTNKGITVMAAYYGNPLKSARRHVNEMGMIDLGYEKINRSGNPGLVHVTGNTIAAERLEWIQGSAKVNVNILSSRKGDENNILNCDFIDGDVAAIKESPVELHCSLIEEDIENKHKP